MFAITVTKGCEMTTRLLECAVCGEDAGRFQQWWNRDTGYGICAKSVAWLRSRGETEEAIRFSYGIEGVHFQSAQGNSNADPQTLIQEA